MSLPGQPVNYEGKEYVVHGFPHGGGHSPISEDFNAEVEESMQQNLDSGEPVYIENGLSYSFEDPLFYEMDDLGFVEDMFDTGPALAYEKARETAAGALPRPVGERIIGEEKYEYKKRVKNATWGDEDLAELQQLSRDINGGEPSNSWEAELDARNQRMAENLVQNQDDVDRVHAYVGIDHQPVVDVLEEYANGERQPVEEFNPDPKEVPEMDTRAVSFATYGTICAASAGATAYGIATGSLEVTAGSAFIAGKTSRITEDAWKKDSRNLREITVEGFEELFR